MRLRLGDISDQEFDTMHEAMLRLLSEYGVLFEDDSARGMLVKAGNRADEEGRVHLSPKFVESMLALVPPNGFVLYGRDESRTRRAAPDALCFRPSTGAPFIHDYATGRRREATMEDVKPLVTLVDALEGFDMVHSVVTPAEAPASAGNIRGFADAHRYSLKPSDPTVMCAQEVEAMARIAAVIRGGEQALRERPLTVVDVAMITPLRCTRDQTEALLECAKWGVPFEVLTQPTLAVSSPITIAGGAALAIAETIAALCLVYLVAPGLGVVSAARVHPINMRTTAINIAGPEVGMASVLMGACFARYHIPSNLYGLGTAAAAPGAQAAMEKTLSGLLMALGHANVITGGGILHNALVTSPEQLVIDNEAIRFIKRIMKPIVISEESIGIDALKQGMAHSGVMLAEAHTIKYMRQGEVLNCGLGQWTSYDQWEREGMPNLIDRAHEQVEHILASHTVPPFDAATERKIEKIVAQFDL